MGRLIDLAGIKYGRLRAIARRGSSKNGTAKWLCLCDCGAETIVRSCELRFGHTQSCGCLQIDRTKTKNTKHGKSKTRAYISWLHMIKRCTDKAHNDYAYYGGRGITVCGEWKNFENFFADMGERPKNKTLDRIDNNGGYERKNCRWATRQQQANNMRSNRYLSCRGLWQTVAEWCRMLNANYGRVQCRLRRGWSVEESLGLIQREKIAKGQ